MYLRNSVTFVLILNVLRFVISFKSEDLSVTLSNGSKLIGRYRRSFSGRPIRAFMSIPYAKPPIGQLRFRAPEPIEKWDGEYEAINEDHPCSQRNPFGRSYEDFGTEDCLYLNVYAPYSYGEKKSNLPVMVWIHGGGFMCGSGASNRPDFFLDAEVILVSFNYRLGPLGFMSTEDENCPGNFGLKDQALALKWVQENIKQFGGDPESVTIFGGSAGGISVTYLMASPLTKGRFSKAIAQSGTNLCPWAQPAHKGVARKRASQLAERFKCYKFNNWSQTIDCLRNVPAVNITAAFYDFFEFDMDPMAPFTPVVETDLPGAFLIEHPRDVITKSSVKIPFMTGLTYDEGLLKTAAVFNLPGLFDEYVNKLDYGLPTALFYDHHDEFKQTSITNQIKEFYFDNELMRERETNLTNLFGDGWFLSGLDSYLHLRLSHEEASPTYVYLFTHRGPASETENILGDPDTFYGVSHGDDLQYLFSEGREQFSKSFPTIEDEKIRKAMIRMWLDFARTGNPTPEPNHLPKWNPVKGFPVDYYRIGNLHFEDKPMFGMEDGGIFEDRAAFWRKIGAFSPTHLNNREDLKSFAHLKCSK